MAERRMFAKTIIDSDAFLDMPLSAQSLYFHLSMRADDDGFINNPRKIQRMIGASDDDLRLLSLKNFIIPFDSGIVVIKHWKIHNYIRNDRYKETVYKDEKQLLLEKDNGSYTVGIPSDNHVVYQMDTQVRLGKDRIGKDRIELGKDRSKESKKSLANAQTACYFPNDETLNKTFLDFIAMRKKLKNGAMTERAITMMINKINKLPNDEAIAMLEQSIINNWKDIYPVKNNTTKDDKITGFGPKIDWDNI